MFLYNRLLNIDLPEKQSAFLWGARKTGKSTFLKNTFPNSLCYDLLKEDLYFSLLKNPSLLRYEIQSQSLEILKYPVIIDEIQRIPALLNEIHWMIEHTPASFILCGSSARKLRRAGVNLLGGRAWDYYCFPLVYPEITDFDLLRVFQNGTIPSHYQAHNIKKSILSYINNYLIQEIKEESLVRNLPAFARFLDSVTFVNGELVNYTNFARETGVDTKTIQEYFQILIDTLIGYYLMPYTCPSRRALITSMPKFYLFDVGVTNGLAKRKIETLKGAEAGKSFEQYIFLELYAYKMMKDIRDDITYWRTKEGLEVDFVIGQATTAIEVKISEYVNSQDLGGLVAFAEEYGTKNLYVVSQEPRMRKITVKGKDIIIMNYKKFLEKLWAGEIMGE